MARPRKRSDDIYNARRRYRRQAERFQKKAQGATGAEKKRYLSAARSAIENALSTYADKSKAQGAVSRVANELGVTQRVFSSRQKTQSLTGSMHALAGNEDADAVARAILSNSNVGSRFYGGLYEVWRGKADRDQAIMDFFGVDNMLDALKAAEKVAPRLYDTDVSDESVIYDLVSSGLQVYVSQRQ